MDKLQSLREHISARPAALAKMKQQGVKIIGCLPGGYLPDELIYAATTIIPSRPKRLYRMIWGYRL